MLPSRSHLQNHGLATRKSWRAPVVIVLALTLGIGLALAHHLMAAYLNGKPVNDVSVSQAWISRISTALAFSVKVALAISVGTAYVQHQWRSFHKASFKTEDVDALTSVLRSAGSFISTTIWLRHPLLALMALVAWGIPIATITAPGSLTVLPLSLDSTVTDWKVPQPQYDDNNTYYGAPGPAPNTMDVNPLIHQLAIRAAAAAEPVPIISSFLNETYETSFDGPAIRCAALANETGVRNISIQLETQGYGPDQWNYVSWAGPGDQFPNLTTATSFQPPILDGSSSNGSRIFVATTAGPTGTEYNVTLPPPNNQNVTINQASVVECVLHNASYSVRSVFRYPGQSHEVTISTWLNTVQSSDLVFASMLGPDRKEQPLSYLAVMAAYGRLLVGTQKTTHYGGASTSFTSMEILEIDWENRALLPQQLERLFQNITLSLLSDSRLTKNSSTAKPINVSVNTWPVTYTYTERDLLLPYGISILCALICAILGFFAFYVNDTSYQNTFSTYLRATNDLDIRLHIQAGDTGCDPLPKALAKTAVTLNGRNATDGTYSVMGKVDDELELQHLQSADAASHADRGGLRTPSLPQIAPLGPIVLSASGTVDDRVIR